MLIKSEVFPPCSLHVAELRALLWASEEAEHGFWTNVFQSCDVVNVVKDILDSKEPCVWKTMYELLAIKSRFCWAFVEA